MNKEQLKVFLRLKLKEIGKAFIGIGIFILGIFTCIGLMFGVYYLYESVANLIPQNTQQILSTILGYAFCLLVIGICITFVGFVLINWIKSNWKKAGKIVRQNELKKTI